MNSKSEGRYNCGVKFCSAGAIKVGNDLIFSLFAFSTICLFDEEVLAVSVLPNN